MDPAPESLPDDVAALKAALIAERARRLEVAAELAVAQAKASEDMALIAAQKLRIAKLERQVYGQRSERSARLIDQLALELGDPELLRGDQRHVLGGFRPRHRQLRRHFQPPRALGGERRLQGGDVVGKRLRSGMHATQRITVRVI